MSAALVVAAIMGTFFIAGLVVGAIIVIALPTLRGNRVSRTRRHEPDGGTGEQEDEGRMSDSSVGRDEAAPDDRPRWPGDAGDGYGG
jgi:hypothetical protein